MQYNNPIIKGFNPDPSICRVGEDFYLVTSTFEYFPGIPVYHSRDLVNWRQIGNCIERPEQLPLEQAKSSGGVWAPTIRYDDGVFYVTATFDGMGNFIVKSTNPATGWSDPLWTDFGGLDPSIFLENGEMYYCANDCGARELRGGEGISMAKIDRETGEIIGKVKRIWQGIGGGWLEAPHIYHIGEYYYIITAEGGTNSNHMVTAGRSKSIWGPYELCPENPILTNRNDTSRQVNCSGHADLFEDGHGNWWVVHLGTRPVQGMSSLGRETFLMPVTWEDGWPKVGADKKCHLCMEGPLLAAQKPDNKWNCDFFGDTMELQWLYRRIPSLGNYIRRDGSLELKPSKFTLRDAEGSPTFIALRPRDNEFTAEAECEFVSCEDGAAAGLVVYLSEQFMCRIFVRQSQNQKYVAVGGWMGNMELGLYQQQLETDKPIKFKIVSDKENYYFYYHVDDREVLASKIPTRFFSCEIAGKCFTGALIGLFAELEKAEGDEVLNETIMKVSSFRFY